MPIARYYDEGKNAEGGSLPGVPLRDLEQAEFEAYPAHIQRSIDASPMYRKTRPQKAASKPRQDRTPPADEPKAVDAGTTLADAPEQEA